MEHSVEIRLKKLCLQQLHTGLIPRESQLSVLFFAHEISSFCKARLKDRLLLSLHVMGIRYHVDIILLNRNN